MINIVPLEKEELLRTGLMTPMEGDLVGITKYDFVIHMVVPIAEKDN